MRKKEWVFDWSEEQIKNCVRAKHKGFLYNQGNLGDSFVIEVGPLSQPISMGEIHVSHAGFVAKKYIPGMPSDKRDTWSESVDYLFDE